MFSKSKFCKIRATLIRNQRLRPGIPGTEKISDLILRMNFPVFSLFFRNMIPRKLPVVQLIIISRVPGNFFLLLKTENIKSLSATSENSYLNFWGKKGTFSFFQMIKRFLPIFFPSVLKLNYLKIFLRVFPARRSPRGFDVLIVFHCNILKK